MRAALTGICAPDGIVKAMSTLTNTDSESASRPLGGRVAWALPMLLPALGLAALQLAGAQFRTVLTAAGLAILLGVVLHRQAGRSGVCFGWASRVTLARAGLVAVLAAALIEPSLYRDQGWMVAGLALLVLALDGVDGWLARRLNECSDFGARFDMEVDAALVLVLSLGVRAAGLAGLWVLLIGLMRYAFVLAGAVWPWLREPLPPSMRRKLVCVWQISALVLVLTPLVGPPMATFLLLSSLAGLALSFVLDVAWLKRHRASPTAT